MLLINNKDPILMTPKEVTRQNMPATASHCSTATEDQHVAKIKIKQLRSM